MANIIVEQSKCCVRAITQYNEEGIEPREIHGRLCAVYAQCNVMAECNVYRWVEQFNEGRMMTHNEDQSGQLSTIA